jgi:hypothetical protein
LILRQIEAILTEAFGFPQFFPASVRIDQMSPCDTFLFPKLKNTLKGKIFEDMQTIEHNEMEQLLPVSESLISEKCFLH